MKQYRITSADMLPPSTDDCFLSPDDPIHALKPASMMGGLGSNEALARYNALMVPKITGSNKGQIARELGLKPGTEPWFKHWFGNNK